MGRNKKIRTRLDGLERAIAVHLKKIDAEQSKPHPNNKRIHHWRGEIDEWEKQIERLTKRLRTR